MSLVEGGRWLEVAVAVVWGTMPVRIMGGVRSVEIAERGLAIRAYTDMCQGVSSPLLLCSLTAPMVVLKLLSSEPPME